MVKRFLCGLILLTFVVGGTFGQSEKSKSKGKSAMVPKTQAHSESSIQPTNTGDDFIIGKEDVLLVSVWREPELSNTVVVRPDGKISVPLINEIQASGLTTKQLQDQIAEKLKEFVAGPVVTVIVKEIHSQVVHIMGQVGKAGAYPFGTPITVVELISRAGGFKDYAKVKKIRILRTENGQQRQFSFNYKDFVNGKKIEQNVLLKNGDIVVVP